MSFGRLEEIQGTIAQSSSSRSNNNNKIYNDEHLQSKKMPSKNKTKNNKEDFTLLIRLKVRFLFIFFFENIINRKKNTLLLFIFYI
jgi:hypothetical protein